MLDEHQLRIQILQPNKYDVGRGSHKMATIEQISESPFLHQR